MQKKNRYLTTVYQYRNTAQSTETIYKLFSNVCVQKCIEDLQFFQVFSYTM